MNILTKYNQRMKGPDGKKIFTSIGLTLIIIISFFGGYFTHFALKGKNVQVVSEVVEIMDKVGFVYDPNTDTYVKLEGDKVAQLIAGNFLDGYSAYYTKEEYEKLLEENSGKYVGIGVSFASSEMENSNAIAKVSVNSPAYNAGVKAGDKVTQIRVHTDQEEKNQFVAISNGKQLADFMQTILEGQAVDLIVDRQGQPLNFDNVVKTTYYMSYVTYQDSQRFAYFSPQENENVDSLDDAFDCIKENPYATGNDALGQDSALVTLSAFDGDAGYQMGAIVKYMVQNGRTRLILNLCGNGGGDMRVLTQVASYLIYNQGKSNYKIVSANEKLDGDGVQTEEGYRVSNFTVGQNNFNQSITKISVIADRSTASASECLIGAMIHYGDDIFDENDLVVVGSKLSTDTETVYRTYGKGIMQTTYRLQSGGALKLTTAKITWPDDETCIHKVGIKPTLEENKCNTFDLAFARAIQITTANA